MAADDIAIANLALGKIGCGRITSLTQSGSEQAAAVNNVYTNILTEVLSEHPWSFAQKRVALSYVCPDDVSRNIDDNVNTPITITGATQANPVVITAASHGLSAGDWVYITEVVGMTELNGNFYIVADPATNTFELTDTDGDDVDGTGYTAYTSDGQIQEAYDYPIVDNGTVVVYQKPSDLVKPIMKSDEFAVLKVEGTRLISDTTGLKLIYTYLNTTETEYFPQFDQALSTRLASEVAFTLLHSVSKSQELLKLYYDEALPRALAIDSTQNTPIEARQNEWLDARLTGAGGYATFGETWHSI